jgi:MFS family permease
VLTIHDTGASIAVFAAPFIALFLLQFFPWRGIFVVFGFIFLACALVFSFASSELKLGNPPKTVFRDLAKIPSPLANGHTLDFGSGAHLGIYAIVPLYLAKELGLPIGYANTILGYQG